MKKYTTFEIAKMLDVNLETVRRWIRAGELQADRDSKKEGWLIDETDLSIFVSNKPKYRSVLASLGIKTCDKVVNEPLRRILKNTLQQLIKERDKMNNSIAKIKLLLKES